MVKKKRRSSTSFTPDSGPQVHVLPRKRLPFLSFTTIRRGREKKEEKRKRKVTRRKGREPREVGRNSELKCSRGLGYSRLLGLSFSPFSSHSHFLRTEEEENHSV